MGKLIVFLFLSCSLFRDEIKERPILPDLTPVIQKVERSEVVTGELKKETVNALKSCQQYADASNERFDRLEGEIKTLRAEILSKDLKIKSLEEELETWKKVKVWSFAVVMVIVVFSILQVIWRNRAIIMKLAGIPIP